MDKTKKLRKTIENDYFNADTQKAIIEYNNTEDQIYKNRLYNHYIRPAFDKLAEFLIYDKKLYNIGRSITDLKNEVIAYMIDQIHLYKEEKGKAFSYFNIVCKNHLMHISKDFHAETITKIDIDESSHKQQMYIDPYKEYYDDFLSRYMDKFSDHIYDNVEYLFKKKREQNVVLSIIQIFKDRSKIEEFNKKILYVLIREMTNEKTQTITKITNELKKYYYEMYKIYEENDIIF